LVEQGQVKAGLDLLRKAVTGAPQTVSIRFHYATALARSGDKAQAKKELDQIFVLNPKAREVQAVKNLLNNL